MKAIRLRPADANTLHHLGIAFKEGGYVHLALAAYRQALFLNPQCPAVYNNMGIAFSMQGEADNAGDAYRKAIALRPDYVAAVNNLGVMLSGQGDFQGGMNAFKQAVALDPFDAVAHHNLGNSTFNFRLGNRISAAQATRFGQSRTIRARLKLIAKQLKWSQHTPPLTW